MARIANLFIALNGFFDRILVLLGIRSRRRYWGTVYDSVTKQPLDPASVKLVSVETGAVAESCVTDMFGRYSFLTGPGRYKIIVGKSNYKFPSERAGGDRDGFFGNLYHGEFFDLVGDTDVVTLNIPMDPEKPDWNQQAKQKVVKFSPFSERLLGSLLSVLFWFILVLSALNFYVTRSAAAAGVLGFYVLVFLLNLILPHPRLWGRVWLKQDNRPLLEGVVELCHPDIPDIVVAKSRIFSDGKFFVRVMPGRYLLRVNRQSAGQTAISESLGIKAGSSGVINRNIVI